MAIDWASSDDEEFPDIDVVVQRAKQNVVERNLRTRNAPSLTRDRTEVNLIASRDPEGSSDGEVRWAEKKEKSTVRRRKLGSASDNTLLKPLKHQGSGQTKDSRLASVKSATDAPRVSVRPLRTKRQPAQAPKREESRRQGDRESDNTASEDSMSDFIDDSDSQDSLDETFSERGPAKARWPRSTGRKDVEFEKPTRQLKGSDPITRREKSSEEPDVEPSSRKLKPALPPGSSDDMTEALSRLAISSNPWDCQNRLSPPTTPPKRAPPSRTLVSPQKLPAVPKTPHRPSMDLFWDQEFVDEWNEEHSPKKLFLPTVTKSPAKTATTSKTAVKDGRSELKSKESKKSFGQRRHQVAASFLRELDDTITEGQLAQLASSTGGIQIHWSKTLNTTAGRANWKRETVRSENREGRASSATATRRHHASIELAEKVIDDEHRLLNVIAHEFCHLANFMVSGVTGNPHGKEFKAWAAKVTEAFGDRGIEVTTRHSYDIAFKYVWQCAECDTEFKRHSKSINPDRHRCGVCKGLLKQTRPAPRNNAGQKSEYQVFMQEQMKIVKRENPGSPQKDVMKLVAQKWARQTGSKGSSLRAGEALSSRDANLEGVAKVLEDLVL